MTKNLQKFIEKIIAENPEMNNYKEELCELWNLAIDECLEEIKEEKKRCIGEGSYSELQVLEQNIKKLKVVDK